MEMRYDGTLAMPSSYAKINEEEMVYVDGGGTVKVIASASTARTIVRGGMAFFCGMIGKTTCNMWVAGLSATLGVLVFDFIIDVCNVKFVPINWSVSDPLLPNMTLNLNNYV